MGFRLSAKSKDNDNPEEDFKDEVEPIDFGVVFGGGLQAGNFLIDARYNLGLRNLMKNADSDSIKITNRGISLMAGWKF